MERGEFDFFSLEEEEKSSKKKKPRARENRGHSHDSDFFGMEERRPRTRKIKAGVVIVSAVLLVVILVIIVCVIRLRRNEHRLPDTHDPETTEINLLIEETQETVLVTKETTTESEEIAEETKDETQDETKETEEVKKVPLDKNTNLLIKKHRMCLDMTQTYLQSLLTYYDQEPDAQETQGFPNQQDFRDEIEVVLQGILDQQVLSISDELKKDLYTQSERIVAQAFAIGKEPKEIKVESYNAVVDVYNELVSMTNETNDLLIAYFDANNIEYTVTIGADGISRQVSYSYSEY